jgi:hypothetical protein
VTIFFGALLLATLLGLAFEVLPKAVLALVVAGIALFAAVAFGVHFHHGPGHFIPAPVALIEWPTLGVIIGSSIFVEIASRSGIFTWSAIRLLKMSKGDPWRLLLLLGSLTLVFSAFLNNVTAMIIIGSLTVVACQRLKWDAKPFLLTEAQYHPGATCRHRLPRVLPGRRALLPDCVGGHLSDGAQALRHPAQRGSGSGGARHGVRRVGDGDRPQVLQGGLVHHRRRRARVRFAELPAGIEE